MKISIITTTFNSEQTIEDTLISVKEQCYKNIEHIIIDGASTDSTLDIVNNYPHISKVISEPDNGIYDAMNKGITTATGDIVGFLNSDDVLYNSKVISKIVEAHEKLNIDAVYGDLLYVDQKDLSLVKRYWESSSYNESYENTAWQPPHPTFYAKKYVYEQVGLFDTDFKIGADFEWLFRALFVKKIKAEYIHEIFVKMRTGGASNQSLANRLVLLNDYRKTYLKYHRKNIYLPILRRLLSRIPQFFNKKYE